MGHFEHIEENEPKKDIMEQTLQSNDKYQFRAKRSILRRQEVNYPTHFQKMNPSFEKKISY